MYEQFKHELFAKIGDNFSAEQLQYIERALNEIAYKYTITQNETALATAHDTSMDLVKMYCIVKKTEGLSDGTIYNYGKTLQLFFDKIQKAPDQVTPNDIRIYLYWYKEERDVSDRTLDKYHEYLRHFFTWAQSEGYIPTDPGLNVKAIKHEVVPRRSLSKLEVEYLRRACETPRDKCIIEMLLSTACRVSELCNIKFSEINMDDWTVLLHGKGKKDRYSKINAPAQIAVKEYLATRDDNKK